MQTPSTTAVAEYDVPQTDRFQMIKQYDRHELIFDTNFMGGPRTDDFLIIQITAGRPRTVEVKSHLFLAITENLHGQVPSSGVWRVILRGVRR